MCYNLKTPNGGTEAVIDDNCGVSKFYAIAQTLANDLQVRFLNQVDETESLNWDFKYKDEFYNKYFVLNPTNHRYDKLMSYPL